MALDLKGFIIVVMLVGLSSALFFSAVYDVNDFYNTDIPEDYRNSINEFNKSITSAFEAGQDFVETGHKVSGGAILGGALTGGGAVLKLLLLPFNMIVDVYNFITQVGIILGIPNYILFAFYGIIMISISFLFIRAVVRLTKV